MSSQQYRLKWVVTDRKVAKGAVGESCVVVGELRVG